MLQLAPLSPTQVKKEQKYCRNSAVHFPAEFPHWCFWWQKSEKCIKMLQKLCRKMDSSISALSLLGCFAYTKLFRLLRLFLSFELYSNMIFRLLREFFINEIFRLFKMFSLNSSCFDRQKCIVYLGCLLCAECFAYLKCFSFDSFRSEFYKVVLPIFRLFRLFKLFSI